MREGIPLGIADVWPKPVPDAQNAAPLYQHANTLFQKQLAENLKSGHPSLGGDAPVESLIEAAGGIEKLEPVFDILRKTAGRPRCQFKRDFSQGAARVVLKEPGELRTLCRILSWVAQREASSGNSEAAARDLGVILRIAAHTGEEPISFARIVQASDEEIFLRGAERYLTVTKASPAALLALKEALKSYGPSPTLAEAFIVETVSHASMVDDIDKRPQAHGGADPSKIKAPGVGADVRNSAYTATAIQFARKALPMLRDPGVSDLRKAENFVAMAQAEAKQGGPHAFNGELAGVSPAIDAVKGAVARREMVRVALRILDYHATEGRWPGELKDIGGMLPMDLFTQGPMGYRRTKDGFELSVSGPKDAEASSRIFAYPVIIRP